MKRLAYEESCRMLQQSGMLEPGNIPPPLQRPPRYDDTVLGVQFFRVMLTMAKLEHLTLPWTFFGRSEIRATSFRGTDLSGSVANWNDFIEVNFTAASLAEADLRANLFKGVRFTGASLAGADLRCCGFKQCVFTDADMTGAKLTRKAGAVMKLSLEQQQSIDWQGEDGEEPPGG